MSPAGSALALRPSRAAGSARNQIFTAGLGGRGPLKAPSRESCRRDSGFQRTAEEGQRRIHPVVNVRVVVVELLVDVADAGLVNVEPTQGELSTWIAPHLSPGT